MVSPVWPNSVGDRPTVIVAVCRKLDQHWQPNRDVSTTLNTWLLGSLLLPKESKSKDGKSTVTQTAKVQRGKIHWYPNSQRTRMENPLLPKQPKSKDGKSTVTQTVKVQGWKLHCHPNSQRQKMENELLPKQSKSKDTQTAKVQG